MMQIFLRTAVVVAAMALCLGTAAAADPFYLGTWKIDSAVAGPWVDAPFPEDTAESKTLIGKTVTISAKGIKGPKVLSCAKPQYQVTDTGPEMLFQGELEEPHLNGKPDTPQQLAEKLGFKGTSWKTLDTGCENELEYHFLDERTAAFGLDNYVYMLKKQ